MDLNIVLEVICGAVALVGAFCVVFQIYHMTVIDATAPPGSRPLPKKATNAQPSSASCSSAMTAYFPPSSSATTS